MIILNVSPPAAIKFTSKYIASSKQELKKFEGRYLWKDESIYDSYLQPRRFSDFFVDDSILKLKYNSNITVDLVPVGKNKFYHNVKEQGIEIQVNFEEKPGTPMTALLVMSDGYKEKMNREAGPVAYVYLAEYHILL